MQSSNIDNWKLEERCRQKAEEGERGGGGKGEVGEEERAGEREEERGEGSKGEMEEEEEKEKSIMEIRYMKMHAIHSCALARGQL